VKPAMTLCSGIASTVTNTTAVCTTVIAFLWTHKDRYTEGGSEVGASGAAAQRRKNGRQQNSGGLYKAHPESKN